MMKFLPKLLASALIAVGACAHADVVLDAFTKFQAVESLDTNLGWVSSQTTSDASIFGNYREIHVIKTGSTGTDPGVLDPLDPGSGVRARVQAGKLTFSEDEDQAGVGKIRWDGSQQLGAASFDDLSAGGFASIGSLATGTQFSFTYSSDIVFWVELQVYDTTGNTAYGAFQTQATGLAFLAESIAYTDLLGGALLDWNNVAGIELTLNGISTSTRVDLSVTAPKSVPEPATLAVVGMALLAAGAARRRRK